MKTQLVEALEAGRGVVSRRQHPELRTSCDWAVRKGHLSVVLPGIYALATDAALLDVRARAAMLADPAAVVCRESAATLMGWREFDEPDDLQVASLRIGRRAGFQVEERSVPRRLRRRLDGITTTSRALTALDLVPSWGGEAIDSALRRGVTLDDLRGAFALTPGRPGNVTRTALLGDSCDIPYSAAERAAHRALRAAGVSGWVANRPICDRDGVLIARGDVMLFELRLCIEIDGDEWHLRPAAVLRDRRRDERIARQGWMVVRFQARRVTDDPAEFVRSVVEIVSARRRFLELH